MNPRTPEDQAVAVALGRIFRIMSRPFQPGDVEQYERARAVVLDFLNPAPYQPPVCWAQDRAKGAAGD